MTAELSVAPVANVSPVHPATAAPAPAAVDAAQTGTGPQFPNPSLRLDHGLGMVVIEFRGRDGQVTNSIPSQRQMDAYRAHQIDALPGMRPVPPAPSDPAPTDPVPSIPAPSNRAPSNPDLAEETVAPDQGVAPREAAPQARSRPA